MKLKINFENDVITIPTSVASRIDKASKKDLYILLMIAGDKNFRENFGDMATVSSFCDRYSCTSAELTHAIKFWSASEIFTVEDDQIVIDVPDPEAEKAAAAAKQAVEKVAADIIAYDEDEMSVAETVGTRRKKNPDKKTPEAEMKVPDYTSEQISEILSHRKGTAQLLDDCQREIGRMFSSHEISTTLGLIDYLGLDDEYLLILFAHCKRIEKTSLRYIEKLAISLYDEGYTTAENLQARLKKLEIFLGAEAHIRSMFGISTRAFTKREKESVDKWVNVFGYDIEIIRKAYEITVDTINKPSISYANAVLETWNKEKLKSLDEIDAFLAAKENAPKQLTVTGSFDTDDFFEAALKRSYADNGSTKKNDAD